MTKVASVLRRLDVRHVNAQFCQPPLHGAAVSGPLDAVRLLLDRGAGLETRASVSPPASDLAAGPCVVLGSATGLRSP